MRAYNPELCECGHAKCVHYTSVIKSRYRCTHKLYGPKGEFTGYKCHCTGYVKARAHVAAE